MEHNVPLIAVHPNRRGSRCGSAGPPGWVAYAWAPCLAHRPSNLPLGVPAPGPSAACARWRSMCSATLSDGMPGMPGSPAQCVLAQMIALLVFPLMCVLRGHTMRQITVISKWSKSVSCPSVRSASTAHAGTLQVALRASQTRRLLPTTPIAASAIPNNASVPGSGTSLRFVNPVTMLSTSNATPVVLNSNPSKVSFAAKNRLT